MTTIQYEDFLKLNDKADVLSFSNHAKVFVKCGKSKKALNRMLETSYRAVFRTKRNIDSNKWDSSDINLSCDEFFVVTKSGKVLHFTNSEWGSVGYAK